MIVDDFDKLADLQGRIDRVDRVALDTETTGLKWESRLCGLVLGLDGPAGRVDSFYLPFRHETAEPQLPIAVLKEIVSQLERRRALIVGHNLKFDLKMLAKDGALPDDRLVKVHDTLQLAYLLDGERLSYALDALAYTYLGYSSPVKDWAKQTARARGYDVNAKGYSEFPIADEGWQTYVSGDAFMTLGVHDAALPLLSDPAYPWYGGEDLPAVFEDDMRLLWVLTRMELTGIGLDIPRTQANVVKLTALAVKLSAELNALVGQEVNVNSNPQLHALFTAKEWEKPVDPKTGTVSFGAELLGNLAAKTKDDGLRAFIELMDEYRAAVKMRGTYFENFLKFADTNGVMHPDFKAHGAVTGRLSCTDPAMQTIPKRYATTTLGKKRNQDELAQSEVRMVIIPTSPDHRLVSFDYKAQEIRMFVHYADEPTMRRVLEAGDQDIHEFVAEMLLGKAPERGTAAFKVWRDTGKTLNFAIIYGMGKVSLAESLKVPLERAIQLYDLYMATFPRVREFMEVVEARANHRGFIHTAFGRRMRFRLLTDSEQAAGGIATKKGIMRVHVGQRAVTHKALNYLVQGGCADLTRQAMIRIDAALRGTRSRLVNAVHDEVVVEFHVDEYADLLPQVTSCLSDWGDRFTVAFPVEPKPSLWAWGSVETPDHGGKFLPARLDGNGVRA